MTLPLLSAPSPIPAMIRFITKDRAAWPKEPTITLPTVISREALIAFTCARRRADSIETGFATAFHLAAFPKPSRRTFHTSRSPIPLWTSTCPAESLVDTYTCTMRPTMPQAHARFVFTCHTAILSVEARCALVAVCALEPGVALAASVILTIPVRRAC